MLTVILIPGAMTPEVGFSVYPGSVENSKEIEDPAQQLYKTMELVRGGRACWL
jgi:hypothetical protein